MSEKQYVCGYNHCLHQGQKVNASESVVVGKKHYHMDCAETKQKIKLCADTYIGYKDNKSEYPIVLRILNTLIFKNRVSVDFILKNIERQEKFYADKPVYALYGLRTLFWQIDRW